MLLSNFDTESYPVYSLTYFVLLLPYLEYFFFFLQFYVKIYWFNTAFIQLLERKEMETEENKKCTVR